MRNYLKAAVQKDAEVRVQPAAGFSGFVARWVSSRLVSSLTQASLSLGKGKTKDEAIRDLLRQTGKDLQKLMPFVRVEDSTPYGF